MENCYWKWLKMLSWKVWLNYQLHAMLKKSTFLAEKKAYTFLGFMHHVDQFSVPEENTWGNLTNFHGRKNLWLKLPQLLPGSVNARNEIYVTKRSFTSRTNYTQPFPILFSACSMNWKPFPANNKHYNQHIMLHIPERIIQKNNIQMIQNYC